MLVETALPIRLHRIPPGAFTTGEPSAVRAFGGASDDFAAGWADQVYLLHEALIDPVAIRNGVIAMLEASSVQAWRSSGVSARAACDTEYTAMSATAQQRKSNGHRPPPHDTHSWSSSNALDRIQRERTSIVRRNVRCRSGSGALSRRSPLSTQPEHARLRCTQADE